MTTQKTNLVAPHLAPLSEMGKLDPDFKGSVDLAAMGGRMLCGMRLKPEHGQEVVDRLANWRATLVDKGGMYVMPMLEDIDMTIQTVQANCATAGNGVDTDEAKVGPAIAASQQAGADRVDDPLGR